MKATQVRIITPTARERASAARPAIMVLAFVIVSFVGIAFLPQAGFNNAPVGIRNPGGDGARALAQVLEHHGITVSEVSATQAASVDENTTLVVVFPSRMSAQLAQEVETRESVVYVGLEEEYGGEPPYLAGLHATRSWDTGQRTQPGCASEAAQHASELFSSAYSVSASSSTWHLCFTTDGQNYAYAERVEDGRFRAVIPDSVRVRNRAITEGGNAALAINAIGRTNKVAWFVASHGVSVSSEQVTPTDSPFLAPAFLMVLGSALLAAAARGTRLGPLTPEQLPIEVPAAETLIGKARLMRAMRSYGHAARELRSASASRIASSLGVTYTADRETLAREIEQRGLPPSRYKQLLWGPPPTDEAALVQLANDLYALEKEIRHD